MISSIDLKILHKYKDRDTLVPEDILSFHMLSDLGLMKENENVVKFDESGNQIIHIRITIKGNIVIKDTRTRIIFIKIKDFFKSFF